MPPREIATVENCIAEAREMQQNGQYINGTVFHMLADEVGRLRAALSSALDHCDRALHPDDQYRDERPSLYRFLEDHMSYHDFEPKTVAGQIGKAIYMDCLDGRRGFRYDQLGIDDDDIWTEIFEEIGQKAIIEVQKISADGAKR